jgi:serine phosphatase RsbU (regulator of sigma subunit)
MSSKNILMIQPKIPENEHERLNDLYSYSILDTLPEKEYEDITYLASHITDTPISLITLIDDKRQWFKSHHGIYAEYTPKEVAFCAHAINDQDNMMIVPDSRKDERFFDNPLVKGEPHVIFYAGIPLVSPNGYSLGTLCVIDNKPREFSEKQQRALQALANQVMQLFQLRKTNKQLEEKSGKLEEMNISIAKANKKLEQKNLQITLQKTEIEKVHTKIRDSINYASLIQNAALPVEDVLRDNLTEHFILYKPKDIVSGDFYWMKSIGQYIVVAAVDCTGHGVPGAFMSMLGISFFNEIINDQNMDNTGAILDILRLKVIHSLNQSGKTEQIQDGMDLSMCCIDKKNMLLYFSGANNPIYLLRQSKQGKKGDEDNISFTTNDNSTLEEIEADLQPIGICRKRQPFRTHTLKIAQNDVIYLFSDGYYDQLGGTHNRKFNSPNFKKLLLQIYQEPFPKQSQILDTTFENWRNSNPQTDDVLVIGLKI